MPSACPKGSNPLFPATARADRHRVRQPCAGQGRQALHRLLCPIAKWTVAGVASRATAALAAGFLDHVVANMPFAVRGIQFDGGSEFMAGFEQACQTKGLNLFVLPPKRPKLNGAVERCNGAWRYEFYAVHDLPHLINRLQPFVDAFAHRYNHHRPHDALDGQTPAEHLSTLSSGASPPSHMS